MEEKDLPLLLLMLLPGVVFPVVDILLCGLEFSLLKLEFKNKVSV
jgi:hypothetical protein